MGCNQSLDKKEAVAGNKRIFETRQKGSCVVEIVRANNLPNMDIVSLTDAFVTFSFRECMHGAHKTKPLGDISYRTLTCNNSLNPIFNTFKDFPFVPKSTDVLYLKIFDEDIPGISDEFIGDAEILYENLLKANNEEVTVNIYSKTKTKPKNNKPVTITVRLVAAKTFSRKTADIRESIADEYEDKKEIFIIRHGESKWNQAQSGKDVGGLLKQFDHELTSLGVKQASLFNEKWKKDQATAKNSSKDMDKNKVEDVNTFLSATKIFSSPLTRAIETALVTCEGHPALKKHGLKLLRHLREKKNIGSFDTVGQFSGDKIAPHVSKCLREDGKDMDAEKINKVTKVQIDPNDAKDEWWTRLEVAEKPADIKSRWEYLFNYLRYATPDDKVIVLVGHSHFFRALCQEYISKEYRAKDPEWTNMVSKGKLDNASCLRCTLKWKKVTSDNLQDKLNPTPDITKCKLVFDSKIVGGLKGTSSSVDLNAAMKKKDEELRPMEKYAITKDV